MKKFLAAWCVFCCFALMGAALADVQSADTAVVEPESDAVEAAAVQEEEQTEAEPEESFEITTAYRWFISQYLHIRTVKVSYYDNVYAYNHGNYDLTPFASTVPSEYFVMDENGTLAIAPIVLDITDEMRERLYGGDVGETAMFYGQYCERLKNAKGHYGYSGIHEGIDFVSERDSVLHAILGGEVTKAGDSNGTVGIYNAEYDVTLLYLHCVDISVKRGDVVEAGDIIAGEGNKAIYNGQYTREAYAKLGLKHTHRSHYVHVEMRQGRHTSSSPYRNTKLESDCPYAVMQAALGVVPSGRQPVTMAAVQEAQRMREAAEAEARRRAEEEEAAKAALIATPEPVPVVEEAPQTAEGYGFGDATEAPAQ